MFIRCSRAPTRRSSAFTKKRFHNPPKKSRRIAIAIKPLTRTLLTISYLSCFLTLFDIANARDCNEISDAGIERPGLRCAGFYCRAARRFRPPL
jgi:hypothetical protein